MSKELPKVSVVTITYGHEKYIKETLDGVLMQQYKGPVEFIIANDNSPDATDEVVKKYFSENPAPSNFEIKYTKHETNKGMMPNFIWALEQATGKYIALCEGDDYWIDPLKLQKQVDFLEENEEYVLVGHHRYIVDENSELIQNRKSTPMYYTQCILFKNLIKSDFLNYRNTIVNGDTFLMTYLENFGNKKNLDFYGAAYRISNAGVWSNIDLQKRNELARSSLDQMESFFEKYNYEKSLRIVKKYKIDIRVRYVRENKGSLIRKFATICKLAIIHRRLFILKAAILTLMGK